MYDFELGPPSSVLFVAVLEKKLMLDTVSTTLGILLSVGKRKRFQIFSKEEIRCSDAASCIS